MVVGQAQLGRKVGQMDRTGAQAGEAKHLLHGVVDVDDRHLVRHGQAFRVDRCELTQVVGEGAADRLPVPFHQAEMSERRHFRVQDLGLHPVAVHGRQPGDGIGVAGITERIQVPIGHVQFLAPLEPLLIGRLHADGVVEGFAQ